MAHEATLVPTLVDVAPSRTMADIPGFGISEARIVPSVTSVEPLPDDVTIEYVWVSPFQIVPRMSGQ